MPIWDENEKKDDPAYKRLSQEDLGDTSPGKLKTLHSIAAGSNNEIALVTLKGDIDNLGALFQSGLAEPTLRAGLHSRVRSTPFALWLPWYCAHGENRRFRNTYTVFAGGDDFF